MPQFQHLILRGEFDKQAKHATFIQFLCPSHLCLWMLGNEQKIMIVNKAAKMGFLWRISGVTRTQKNQSVMPGPTADM